MTPVAGSAGVLLAYIHIRPATPTATRFLLKEYIRAFADREGFALGAVIVAEEGSATERLRVRQFVREINRRSAATVLVAGADSRATRAAAQIAGVRVLTLADVARLLERGS